MTYGLIGKKLGHSFSKTIHETIADYTYDLIELNEEEFHTFMKEKKFNAINVTIPYKQAVIPYLDELDEKASNIQAVNAIRNDNGRLIGTNTDYDGLRNMILNHFNIENKIVAILGSGGTSKTAHAVCESLNVKEIIKVARNRNDYVSYEDFKNRKDVEIIINTTSVGMSPDILSSIIDLNDYPNCVGVIDVIFNPLLTSLCYQAKQLNIKYINGLEMLVGQAVVASEFFTGKTIDHSIISKLSDNIYKDKQNIVLIGMPSCGKTSLGKKLSKIIHYDFVDMDREIVKKAGMTIPEIFEKYGEEEFRRIETEVCIELSKRNHTVISCGGGVIKKEINMKALALNGKIVYIKRSVKHLIVGKGRPLSTDMDALHKMYEERHPLYMKYSDLQIKNKGRFYRVLDKLVEVIHENISH